MSHTDRDVDDAARLVLQDMRDDGVRGPIVFRTRLEDLLSEIVSLDEVARLYTKYCGMDGRTLPTHSIDTGKPL